MADALKFMLEMVDRWTGPVTKQAAAALALNASLVQLKSTVGELAAMPAVNLKLPKVSGGAGRGRASDPNATGAMDLGGAKIAAAAEKQRKAQEKAIEKQAALDKKAAAQAEKAAKQKADTERRQFEKGMKQQERAVAKEKKAKAKAAAEAKKAFEKTSVGAFEKAFKGASDSAAGFDVLGSAAGAIVNPVTLAVAAVAALGAALIGLGALLLKGAELAIDAAEAKNDTLDMLEAMLGTAEAAQRVNDAIEDVTRDTAVSQAGVREMAASLTAAGVTNEAMLLDAVKAISQTESVLKGAGSKIQNIVEKAAATGKFTLTTKQLVGTGVQLSALYAELAERTGKGVKEVEQELKKGTIDAETGIAALTKVLDKKFGAVAAKQALDFGAQMQRARDNIARLFEDVDTGPFLEALNKMLSILDQSTPAGKALHDMLTRAFDGIFDAATAVLPYIRIGLKGIALIALKVWVAFRPVAAAIAQAFGADATAGVTSFEDAVILVADAIGVVAQGIASFLQNKTVIDGIIANFRILWGVIKFVAESVGGIIAGILAVVAVGAALTSWVMGLGAQAYDAGAAIVNGLINGLAATASRLIDSVRNLAQSAIDTFRGVFDMHSPSKVMMGLGGNITAGLAKGIDNGAKAANDNMGNVVSIESARARSEQPVAAKPSGASSGASYQLTFTEGAIQINGTNMTAAEVRAMFPEMFVDAVEQMALSQGAGEKVA